LVVGLALGLVGWLLVQVDAATAPPAPAAEPAPVVVTTPWPAELPCAHPSKFWFNESFGTVTWSSADGGETHSLAGSTVRDRKRVPRGFPTGRLTRLTIPGNGAKLPHLIGGLDCRRDSDDIMWGPCTDGICQVSVTYPGRPLSKVKQRTRHWTDEIPGSPWADTAPDVHWNRFLRDIGRKETSDPDAARESMRFTRAFVRELRDLLAVACRRRRCAQPARDADAALAAYLRDPSPIHANAAQHEADHWNYVWKWTATGGGVTLRLSCDDMTESRSELCDLTLDLPGDLTLNYGTFEQRIEIYAATDREYKNRIGCIADVSPDRGPPRISIEGRLLELGEVAGAKK